MTKSEAESLPKPYPTATSPEKLQTTTITTRESTESQELAGTLANTSHRSRPRGRGEGGAEEGLDPDPQKRREGKGRGRPQIQIPPHLPRRSRAVLSISRCMEVMRAREKGQGERELRRSLDATTVTLYSGGFEGAWVAARREGGAARHWHGRKCERMVEAAGRQRDERKE